MDIVREISELVKEECAKDSNPYGSSNSWKHMNHVVRLAKSLAQEAEADKEIVELAAWLHDWGAIQGFYEDHHIRGATAAEEILNRFGYPEQKIKQIKHCVFTHRSNQGIKPETTEAECVANADAIAHFLEIPDLLCSKYTDGNATVEEVVVWLREKLRRDCEKITLTKAKEMVAPYLEAAGVILGKEDNLTESEKELIEAVADEVVAGDIMDRYMKGQISKNEALIRVPAAQRPQIEEDLEMTDFMKEMGEEKE